MFRYSEVAKLSKSWDHGELVGKLSLLKKVFLGVEVCKKVVGFRGRCGVWLSQSKKVDSGELARLRG